MSTPNEYQPDPTLEKFRLFIALPVPQAVRDKLRRAQAELQSRLRDDGVRWTRPEQIHLTLKFLGNVASADLLKLVEATGAACRSFGPIQLSAQGIGFFPSVRRPRIVWADVREEGNRLRSLQAAISRASAPFTAEKDDKEFAAHLTLGRVRNIMPDEARSLGHAAQGMSERIFGEWPTDRVEIIRSELGSEGSRYSVVAAVRLQAPK